MRLLLILLVLAFGFSHAQAAEPSKMRALSFVLVTEPKLPDAQAFRAELEKRVAGRFKVSDMEADGQKVILLRMHGGTVMIGLIDAPLPKGQIDDLCAGAWYWRQACEATALHRAQIVASVLDTNLDTLDANLLLTDVVATLMDGNAVASYWEASLQSREAVLRQSARISREAPPVWLWVNFRVTNDLEKGISLSTQGMEELNLREIEAKDVNRPGREVFGLLLGMAQYLVSRGPVIKDGETIGESPALNIRVRQGPSYWREGATVYRVTWPK
ncbi:MAG: DUF4261 domain-containing protein [Ramlibacter sp.]